jgi:FAD:protein FMN transferase
MSAQEFHQHQFRSMGSDIEVLLVGGTWPEACRAFYEAELLAEDWMEIFSRFRDDSELSMLNAASGRSVSVSETLFDAVEMSIQAAHISGGLFNPLVLPALIAHGYDRSLEQLAENGNATATAIRPPAVQEIVLDPDRRTVQLPHGSAIDLGGIAKGLYADLVAERLADWSGGVVSAGGDMRLWGVGPDDGEWLVGVENPCQRERDVAIAILNNGAMATSGTNRRRWVNRDASLHHLIDPRTGSPADSRSVTMTVFAPTAGLAEAGATALLIDPGAVESQTLTEHLWACLAVDSNQHVTFTEFDAEAPFDVRFI